MTDLSHMRTATLIKRLELLERRWVSAAGGRKRRNIETQIAELRAELVKRGVTDGG